MVYVYILRLRSGALYIGSSHDPQARFQKHLSGKGARTTSIDPPESIAYTETWIDLSSARRREAQLKKWSRNKKEALIAGSMENLKRLAIRRDSKKSLPGPK